MRLKEILQTLAIPALITIITFYGSYFIARKQMTNSGVTQFRQRWIDDLRNCIATYISVAEVITMVDLDDDETYFKYAIQLFQMQNKIELMLNPFDQEHNEVVKITNRIRDLVHDETSNSKRLEGLLIKETEDLLTMSKTILKKEWVMVKKGK